MRNMLCLILFVSSFFSCDRNDPREAQFETELNKASILEKDRPNLVWRSKNEPDPLTKPPAIFYSPHQDDETLGMGASIAEHARIGVPTYVVLLTDGANDSIAHDIGLSPDGYVQERMREFISACQLLGAHRIYIANSGKGYRYGLPEGFRKTMRYFVILYPAASHKTISGNCDAYDYVCSKNSDHQYAADAIWQLQQENMISDVRLYRVYVYHCAHALPNCILYGCRYVPPFVGRACCKPANARPVNPIDKAKRQIAFSAYRDPDPSRGIGYWSVPELFDISFDSDCEYVDVNQDCDCMQGLRK